MHRPYKEAQFEDRLSPSIQSDILHCIHAYQKTESLRFVDFKKVWHEHQLYLLLHASPKNFDERSYVQYLFANTMSLWDYHLHISPSSLNYSSKDLMLYDNDTKNDSDDLDLSTSSDKDSYFGDMFDKESDEEGNGYNSEGNGYSSPDEDDIEKQDMMEVKRLLGLQNIVDSELTGVSKKLLRDNKILSAAAKAKNKQDIDVKKNHKSIYYSLNNPVVGEASISLPQNLHFKIGVLYSLYILYYTQRNNVTIFRSDTSSSSSSNNINQISYGDRFVITKEELKKSICPIRVSPCSWGHFIFLEKILRSETILSREDGNDAYFILHALLKDGVIQQCAFEGPTHSILGHRDIETLLISFSLLSINLQRDVPIEKKMFTFPEMFYAWTTAILPKEDLVQIPRYFLLEVGKWIQRKVDGGLKQNINIDNSDHQSLNLSSGGDEKEESETSDEGNVDTRTILQFLFDYQSLFSYGRQEKSQLTIEGNDEDKVSTLDNQLYSYNDVDIPTLIHAIGINSDTFEIVKKKLSKTQEKVKSNGDVSKGEVSPPVDNERDDVNDVPNENISSQKSQKTTSKKSRDMNIESNVPTTLNLPKTLKKDVEDVEERLSTANGDNLGNDRKGSHHSNAPNKNVKSSKNTNLLVSVMFARDDDSDEVCSTSSTRSLNNLNGNTIANTNSNARKITGPISSGVDSSRRYFIPQWFDDPTIGTWLRYDEKSDTMFCKMCEEYPYKVYSNSQRIYIDKTPNLGTVGSRNFRYGTLKSHDIGNQAHLEAVRKWLVEKVEPNDLQYAALRDIVNHFEKVKTWLKDRAILTHPEHDPNYISYRDLIQKEGHLETLKKKLAKKENFSALKELVFRRKNVAVSSAFGENADDISMEREHDIQYTITRRKRKYNKKAKGTLNGKTSPSTSVEQLEDLIGDSLHEKKKNEKKKAPKRSMPKEPRPLSARRRISKRDAYEDICDDFEETGPVIQSHHDEGLQSTMPGFDELEALLNGEPVMPTKEKSDVSIGKNLLDDPLHDKKNEKKKAPKRSMPKKPRPSTVRRQRSKGGANEDIYDDFEETGPVIQSQYDEGLQSTMPGFDELEALLMREPVMPSKETSNLPTRKLSSMVRDTDLNKQGKATNKNVKNHSSMAETYASLDALLSNETTSKERPLTKRKRTKKESQQNSFTNAYDELEALLDV